MYRHLDYMRDMNYIYTKGVISVPSTVQHLGHPWGLFFYLRSTAILEFSFSGGEPIPGKVCLHHKLKGFARL